MQKNPWKYACILTFCFSNSIKFGGKRTRSGMSRIYLMSRLIRLLGKHSMFTNIAIRNLCNQLTFRLLVLAHVFLASLGFRRPFSYGDWRQQMIWIKVVSENCFSMWSFNCVLCGRHFAIHRAVSTSWVGGAVGLQPKPQNWWNINDSKNWTEIKSERRAFVPTKCLSTAENGCFRFWAGYSP